MRVPQSTLDLILAQGGLPDSQPHELQEMLVMLVSDLRDERNPPMAQHTVYSVMRKALYDALAGQLRQNVALVIKDLSIDGDHGGEVQIRVGIESPNGLWGSIRTFHGNRLISSIAEEFVSDYASARLKAKHLLDEPFGVKP